MPPSHRNLIIHLELVSWNAVIDVKGDSTILKKITKKGEGFDRANEGSQAKGDDDSELVIIFLLLSQIVSRLVSAVVYLKKLEDGTVVERRGSEEEPFEYVCGEEGASYIA